MIQAKVIAHSVNKVNGQEIATLELEYPRMIHSEFMTHRLFSRNAASSRAIPIDKLIQLVKHNTAYPSKWGLNQQGMQAEKYHIDPDKCSAEWYRGAARAIMTAKHLQSLGLHKQICNRPLEPFQFIKVIVTSTEWNNFFHLRDHKDADPTIHELAHKMKETLSESIPEPLNVGELHLPYIKSERLPNGNRSLFVENRLLSPEEALKVSASCCAQVSYRLLDQSLEKALKIYKRLIESKPKHSSPFEHQATPMSCPSITMDDPLDVRDILGRMSAGDRLDHQGNYWSGNFKGWLQYRQSIEGNTCW